MLYPGGLSKDYGGQWAYGAYIANTIMILIYALKCCFSDNFLFVVYSVNINLIAISGGAGKSLKRGQNIVKQIYYFQMLKNSITNFLDIKFNYKSKKSQDHRSGFIF